MKYKILVQMVQHTADANPDKRWMAMYFGVVDKNVSSQIDSGPMLLAVVPQYQMMCSAISDFINADFAQEVLNDIEQIERGYTKICEEGTEAYMFWIAPESVTFEFQYGLDGPEKGGEVTLAQFKIAVQTYLQFLRDPERKPIEVPFPA